MSRRPLPPVVDVVIVGGRCAGAATALLLARRGVHALVIERGPAGADTLSTHALMRGGVVQLNRWGLLPAIIGAGTPPITRTTFDYRGDTVAVDISARHGVDALYAPRRTVLDRVLVDAAAHAGADIRHGHRLLGLHRDPGGRVDGVTLGDADGAAHHVRAGLVIGADGRHSTVGRLVGATPVRTGQVATGTVYGHWPGITADGYRWIYGDHASVGVIPTNDGATCVFATVPATRFAAIFASNVAAGFRQVVRHLDWQLAGEIAAAPPLARLQGFAGLTGHFTRSHGPGWALVGDAGYFKDPLTAHGITDALLHAELLADAVVAGGDAALAVYEARRTLVATPVFEATEAIASFDWTFDKLRVLHTRLARVMAAEIDAATAFFGQATGDFEMPGSGLPVSRTVLVTPPGAAPGRAAPPVALDPGPARRAG